MSRFVLRLVSGVFCIYLGVAALMHLIGYDLPFALQLFVREAPTPATHWYQGGLGVALVLIGCADIWRAWKLQKAREKPE